MEFFRHPEIPKKRTRDWKNLVADAATKIRGLAGSAPNSESKVFKDTSGHIIVSKWSAEGRSVGMFRIPEAKYEVEAQAELSLAPFDILGRAGGFLYSKCEGWATITLTSLYSGGAHPAHAAAYTLRPEP